jgi:hypothetical protein
MLERLGEVYQVPVAIEEGRIKVSALYFVLVKILRSTISSWPLPLYNMVLVYFN